MTTPSPNTDTLVMAIKTCMYRRPATINRRLIPAARPVPVMGRSRASPEDEYRIASDGSDVLRLYGSTTGG